MIQMIRFTLKAAILDTLDRYASGFFYYFIFVLFSILPKNQICPALDRILYIVFKVWLKLKNHDRTSHFY